MPPPDGLLQVDEGITRCLDCGGEVIVCRLPDGAEVMCTPVRGERHDCEAWKDVLDRWDE